MHPILFKLGPITIYTYGVFVFLGVLAGYSFCLKQAEKENIDPKVISDILFWSIIFGFVGARLFYIFIEFKQFLDDPVGIGLGRAGFVFYGGVIFALPVFYLLAGKYNLDFLRLTDLVVLALPLAHAIGRIGCFFYGCCYGKPTDSWIGMKFVPSTPAGSLGIKVIPTQLISSLFLFLIFFLLLTLRKKGKFKGQIFLYYIIIYSGFRFIIEFYRGDPRGYLGVFSVSQVVSLILIGVSVILWPRLKCRDKLKV